MNLSNYFKKISTKILLLLFSALTTVPIFCHAQDADDHPKNSTQNPAPTIAITQIVDHPSLNLAREGVTDIIKKQIPNAKFIYDNAQGNVATSVQIGKKFASLNPDVIVAISTPSAQTAMSATVRSQIPIVFVSVTSPIEAKLVSNLQKPGDRVTGSTDAPPYAKQVELIKTLLPKAKTIGVLYNPGEVNSVDMVKNFQEEAKDYKILTASTPTTNEVAGALRSLIGKIDVLYIPMDNTVVSAYEVVGKIAADQKLPIIASDPDTVKRGALAAIGYNHYNVGQISGQQVLEILGGKKAGDIPVTAPTTYELTLNMKTAKVLDITVTPELLQQVDELVD